MNIREVTRRGRGRPIGPPRAREEILASARHEFATAGYAKVSMRAIATRAGVDPRLVVYHYGSKSRLFERAVEVSTSREAGRRAVAQGTNSSGRLASWLLAVLQADSPSGRGVSLARAVATDPRLCEAAFQRHPPRAEGSRGRGARNGLR